MLGSRHYGDAPVEKWAAIGGDLPVVAEGQVVKTFTENAHAITDVARQYRGEKFAISDLVANVDCSRETVRRTLNEFAEFGYLTKHETNEGLATGFAEPDAGVVAWALL